MQPLWSAPLDVPPPPPPRFPMVCFSQCRSSTIKEEEFIIPGSHDNASPAKVVIKTNPLFSTSAPVSELGHHSNSGQEEAECVFYGQRRKIRKTKEQEMINAIMDITMYGKCDHINICDS